MPTPLKVRAPFEIAVSWAFRLGGAFLRNRPLQIGLLAGSLALSVFGLPTRTVSVILDPTTLQAADGHAYRATLPRISRIWRLQGDTLLSPQASTSMVLEDGHPLGPGHMASIEVSSSGRGAFSHWGNTLEFSASDNSDPRTNGRTYTVTGEAHLARPIRSVIGLLAACLAALCLLALAVGGYLQRRTQDLPEPGATNATAADAADSDATLAAKIEAQANLSRRLRLPLLRHAARRLPQWPLFAAMALLPIGLITATAPPLTTYDLPSRAFNRDSGNAYAVDIRDIDYMGPRKGYSKRSQLVVLENAKTIGPARSRRADIREKGAGRFSHRGHSLYISTPDNSDPRINGRTYSITLPNVTVLAFGWLAAALGLAAFIIGALAPTLKGSERTTLRRKTAVMASATGTGLALLGIVTLASPIDLTTGFTKLQPTIERIAAPDVFIFLGLLLLGAAVGWLRAKSNGARLGAFLGAAGAVLIIVNMVLLGSGPLWPVLAGDSTTYFHYNACRTPGYMLFLYPMAGLDPFWTVTVQLQLLLGSLIALAAAVAFATRSSLAGIATLIVGLAFGSQLSYAFAILTEAPFTAALTFAIAGAVAYLRSPSLWLAVGIGCATAFAIAIKASAPTLMVSAGLLLLLPAPERLRRGLALIGIPALTLIALLIAGRMTNGAWSPTNFMGFALSGNVAFAIKSDELSSNPELSALIDESIREYHQAWPHPIDLDNYVKESTNDYNPMLWGQIVPIVRHDLQNKLGSLSGGCPKELNQALMTLSKEAIQREPGRVMLHALAHYYGLWSFAGIPQPLGKIASKQRDLAVRAQSDLYMMESLPEYWRAPEKRLSAVAASQRAALRPLQYDVVQKILAGIWNGPFLLIIGLSATLLGTCIIALHRMPPDVAPMVVVAGFLAPYFAISAIFQVSMSRYTAPGQFAIAAFAILFVFFIVSRLARWCGAVTGTSPKRRSVHQTRT